MALPSEAASLKAQLDSSQITMGYQTAIRFDIVNAADAHSEIYIDKEAMPPQIEVIDWVYGDTTDLGNNRIQIDRTLIVQSFDSGIWEIRTDEINVIRKDSNIQSKTGFMFTVTRQSNIPVCEIFAVFL